MAMAAGCAMVCTGPLASKPGGSTNGARRRDSARSSSAPVRSITTGAGFAPDFFVGQLAGFLGAARMTICAEPRSAASMEVITSGSSLPTARMLAALVESSGSKEATNSMFAGILRASRSSLNFFSQERFAADDGDGSRGGQCDGRAC